MRPPGRSAALPPAARTVENQAVLAALLAMIAGYVDAYALIRFSSYASFMSGNTTQAGSRLGRWDPADTVIPLTAVAFLVIGIFVGVWLAHSTRLRSGPVRFALVSALLAAVTALTLAGTIADGPGVALLSLAMGLMNTTLSRVGGQPVNVGFITGGLSAMATHLALATRRVPLAGALAPWDTHGYRALQLGGVWLALFFGAVVSAAVSQFFREVTLVPAILALTGLAAADWKRAHRRIET